jgi:hypothetical protein
MQCLLLVSLAALSLSAVATAHFAVRPDTPAGNNTRWGIVIDAGMFLKC